MFRKKTLLHGTNEMYSHLQYDPSQLVARVRSHLKQYERLTRKQEKEADSTEKITIQNLVIEPGTWKVWKDGEELRLLNREFELLCFRKGIIKWWP